MNEDRKIWILAVVCCVVAVVLLIIGYIDYQECKAKGGVLVRGAFWVECVKPIKLSELI